MWTRVGDNLTSGFIPPLKGYVVHRCESSRLSGPTCQRRMQVVQWTRRKFHSDPVDFGVVGVEESLSWEDEDIDEFVEGEQFEDDVETEDGDVVNSDLAPEQTRRAEFVSFVENSEDDADSSEAELYVDGDIEALVELGEDADLDGDDSEFDDDDDLIDLSDESVTDEMLILEADGQFSAGNGLSFFSESAPFRSSSLEKHILDSTRGYIAPANEGVLDEYSQTWAVAIHPESRYKEARNQYSRVGVNLGFNFPDFTSNPDVDLTNARIEDESVFKAKAVYAATGLPALSISTSWEVENTGGQGGNYFKRTMVPAEVEALVMKLRPRSDKNRKVTFRSIAAFYDGESEMLSEGICEVALYFAAPKYASVAIASAFDSMFKELWKKYQLHFVEQDSDVSVDSREGDVGKKNKRIGEALLKQRILREGKVLDGGILKVSSFLNHMVDAELMDTCGEDLADRLEETMPNKVLTVEATGLIPALSVGRRLSIPVVFARKSRPITISESYQTMYHSKTKGGDLNELIVSTEYLKEGDRVLLIDDFLAGGSTVEALFKLANMARARVVGLGVLIEKTQDGGRAFLSGYDVPVESLAKVTILPDNTLTMDDENGDEALHDHSTDSSRSPPPAQTNGAPSD